MPEQFTTMQDWDRKFMCAVGLSATAKVVGWAMSRYATYETGRNVRPSTSRIAYQTGVSGSRIRGADGYLERLVQTGWLIVVRPATRSSAAVFRLGIGEYRPDWGHDSELIDDVGEVEDDTTDVVHTGDEVVHEGDQEVHMGDEQSGPHRRRGGPYGRHQGGPPRRQDLVLNHVEEASTCASTDVEHDSDTAPDTEPGLPIDLPAALPKTKTASKRAAPAKEVEADFGAWWIGYPRKTGRAKALVAYVKARKSVTAETLTNALARQLPGMLTNEERFRPHGATWLNEKRWEDEVPDASQTDPYRFSEEVQLPPELEPDAGHPQDGPSSLHGGGDLRLRTVSGTPARVGPPAALPGADSARSAFR